MERENINMNDKPEIEIKIFGGTNMIAPAGEYTRLLGECATAHDLAGVVSIMLSEPRVGKDTVVKGTFIEVLLPFASRLTSGAKVDNVRQQINNMLMRQGRGGK